jgi:eukaryotic-like serine/threonine-protein kinase
MGKVWRARHLALKREDALKVLPDAFASDRDRLARFQREAQVVASLNHPNIAHVYGLEQTDGVQALVMELVEGPTLADRIAQGPIPVDEALVIAKQIAEALEAAHEQGIIHRDMKPANIKLRPDGVVKVLDFGLAKALEPMSADRSDATASPTITSPAMMTGVGVLLGTAAYMSPEQARGKPVDKRSDIWAFGCVLYEMLTGKRAFADDDVSMTLSKVLQREPDFEAFPANVPPRVRQTIRMCLRKSSRERIADIHDVRLALEGAFDTSPVHATQHAVIAQPVWRRAIGYALTSLAAAIVIALVMQYARTSPTPAPVSRLSFGLPDGAVGVGSRFLNVSPDGTQLVFMTGASGRLYVRSIGEFAERPLLETSGNSPTFSPDGRSIVFFADGALKRVDVTGGVAVTLCPVKVSGFGLSWSANGIFFAQGNEGVFRVSPNGGTPERVVALGAGELAFGPQMLADGTTLLFTLAHGTSSDDWDAAQIVAQSIATGERKVLINGGREGRYVTSGHLVYARGGVLLAAPFDVRRLELAGEAVPVVDGVRRSNVDNATQHFSVSETGTLVYLPGATGTASSPVAIVIADRGGAAHRLAIPPGPYEFPRVSPNGMELAFGSTGGEMDIWIYNMDGNSAPRRLTFGGKNRFPIWSADGRHVAFQSDRDGDLGIFWQPADGTGTAERLTKADAGTSQVPDVWSPKGDMFLFSVVKSPSRTLWSFSIADKKAERFGQIEIANGVPIAPAFSPDGRWVVYQAGGNYVQPNPPTGTTYQVSTDGFHPVWSRDGREIVYVRGFGRLTVISVSTQPRFQFSKPVEIPRGFNEKMAPGIGKNFDMTSDGRFIGLAAPSQGEGIVPTNQIYVVQNWFEDLKRLAPTN